jgi:hypothetical protein
LILIYNTKVTITKSINYIIKLHTKKEVIYKKKKKKHTVWCLKIYDNIYLNLFTSHIFCKSLIYHGWLNPRLSTHPILCNKWKCYVIRTWELKRLLLRNYFIIIQFDYDNVLHLSASILIDACYVSQVSISLYNLTIKLWIFIFYCELCQVLFWSFKTGKEY